MNKAKQRFARKAQVDTKKCVACGTCVPYCPRKAISILEGMYATIDEKLCIGCALCARVCPAGFITMREATQ